MRDPARSFAGNGAGAPVRAGGFPANQPPHPARLSGLLRGMSFLVVAGFVRVGVAVKARPEFDRVAAWP